VGLESTVQGMMRLGASSLLVGVLGVIAPFALGYGASWLFIVELPHELAAIVPAGFSLAYVHMFIGAVLCATSVGITARVSSRTSASYKRRKRKSSSARR
jgi:Kef-type K+ transport system membrane component KefB